MSLRLRQRSVVEGLLSDAAHQLRASLRDGPEEYEAVSGSDDPPSLESWAEQRFPGLIENYGLSLFQKLVDNPKIGNKILRMRWWLWDFSEIPDELLLSDNPCIFTSGFDDSNFIVALPISPTKAFLTTQGSHVAKALRQQSSRDLLTRLNESSLNQAQVRIYSTDSSPERSIRDRLRQRQ